MPKDDCRDHIANNFAPFPQQTLSVVGSVHLQERVLVLLKYYKTEAERGCLGYHFPLGRVAKGTWRPSKAGWESPLDMAGVCCSTVLCSRWGAECLAEPGEHLASYGNQMLGAERALSHKPPLLLWGSHQAPVAAPKPGVNRELLVSHHVPASKSFSGASAFVSVRGHPAHVFCPPTMGILRQGLCQPHSSCS